METAIRHIGNFITTGDETVDIYLHALNAHLNEGASQRDISYIADTINFLLSKAKTRSRGLELLEKTLPWVNQDLLEQKIQSWISFILKACNQDELQKYGGLIYKPLTSLAKLLRGNAELSKSFASNHLNKVYEIIAQSPVGYYSCALTCAEAYLVTFPKPSGQSRETMERFIKVFPDIFDDQVNHCAGRCLHILQQTVVPGTKNVNSKDQWKSYQIGLVQNLSSILKEAYADRRNIGVDLNADEGCGEFNIAPLKLSSEPNVRAAQLFVRFHNLINYLKIALCEPNLVALKPIMPKKLLNLVTSGLVVTCAALNQDATYSKIAFGVFLPKIQLDLLELCKTLIRVLHSHLRIYYKSLLSCLIHVLKSISSANKTLRLEVYNVITLWCQTLGEGSRCEFYADELVPELLKDISPVKKELISQVKKNDKQKKAIIPTTKNRKEDYTSSQSFYLAAIECLHTILRSCSCFLKAPILRKIQMCTLSNCASFYVKNRYEAYNNWRIRLEMYRLLHTILMAPNQYSPPPSQIIVYMLRTGKSIECNTDIRFMCTKMLQEIETILHPQKETLVIPIEARSIRNAFRKTGEEALLENSHTAISSLRYSQDGEQTVELHRNGLHDSEKAITDDIEEICNDGHSSPEVMDISTTNVVKNESTNVPKAKKHKNSNNNDSVKTTEVVENECSEMYKIKRQKISKNIDSPPLEIAAVASLSDDDCLEIENIKQLDPLEKPLRDVTDTRDETITKTSKQVETLNEKSALPKNDSSDITELEAYFVDELKGN